jgi:hypothetical protein
MRGCSCPMKKRVSHLLRHQGTPSPPLGPGHGGSPRSGWSPCARRSSHGRGSSDGCDFVLCRPRYRGLLLRWGSMTKANDDVIASMRHRLIAHRHDHATRRLDRNRGSAMAPPGPGVIACCCGTDLRLVCGSSRRGRPHGLDEMNDDVKPRPPTSPTPPRRTLPPSPPSVARWRDGAIPHTIALDEAIHIRCIPWPCDTR